MGRELGHQLVTAHQTVDESVDHAVASPLAGQPGRAAAVQARLVGHHQLVTARQTIDESMNCAQILGEGALCAD